MLLQLLWCVSMVVDGLVLDPSLYLAPRPPLTPATHIKSRFSKNMSEEIPVISSRAASKRNPHPAEKARLFWPSFRSSHNIGGGTIQVPLTFSLSGLYGKYSPGSPGTPTRVIASSYGTVLRPTDTARSSISEAYGKYGTYPGLRVYGSEQQPTWSGWGNGKWGHYGRG